MILVHRKTNSIDIKMVIGNFFRYNFGERKSASNGQLSEISTSLTTFNVQPGG